ncbi:5-formyltetrahydrofolate cyclo-ligase [Streptococcus pseudoporcinus]|uniref:5-formyltetrahydrofolate cyclo-ligase n=1 Tax=Streptococcus pseudoporcinus TaxID=361101 RepID=A0A4U9YF43_9STRE|nr:5-formyltetrahydrofolate cyclo-ligase [Streptococcus pseudoporcinus]VTS24806.1 5-formyltetrahydrofolate cyclo-ligase [Streptococcus pseudoporcinus]VUC71159.1 5-formyltetrahydrofolate cyclo-ligase [Streptococcus pseudoporcinus]VUD00703.1 5-formyltetrahydrofolate cyclo-ligase [Streptococcus pseudoporcinus]VUD01045.1 5-formyltetrahydrofolate cyclo-ligase [Streptococcus pseudoporcinus]
MIKKDIRNGVLATLKVMDKKEKHQKDLALLEAMISTSAYQQAKVIATYLAMPTEYETGLLIKQALSDGKLLVIPKTYPKGRMIFVVYDRKNLERSSFGLLEPTSEIAIPKKDIDMIHVPGVAFNAEGYRIGYGAGYYDRYLSDYKGATMSTIYDCQQSDFQAEPYDIAVQEVLVR